MSRVMVRMVLAVGTLVCLAGSVSARQATTTATDTKKFEVIAVDGNQLVVKLPEGTREITVPDDFRFTIDGRQMSVRELKPGMKGMANITTKTTVTPVTVTEVKNGTVVQASGASVIVRTDQGFKMFSQGDVDKRGVKIYRHGEPAAISDFHSGDKLSATIITAKPPRIVSQKEVNATLAREGGAPAGATGGAAAARPPTAAAPERPAAAPATAAPPAAATGGSPAPAKKLPKTASSLPLLGLTGLMFLLAAATLTVTRRRLSR
jgi:hypothetical protein